MEIGQRQLVKNPLVVFTDVGQIVVDGCRSCSKGLLAREEVFIGLFVTLFQAFD